MGRLIGFGLLIACLGVSIWDLYHLAQIGTCASGPSPYEISRQCPQGSSALGWSLAAAIFVLFPAAALTRSAYGWLLMWCGIFLGGALALLLTLLNGSVSSYGGARGAIIVVAVVFIPMGIAPLFFLGSLRDGANT
ncbi:MAG: hypothetical protein ABR584_03165 [Candidatus Baltobacteraceae bacterium]